MSTDRPAPRCTRCSHPEHPPFACGRQWPDVANMICVCQGAPVAQEAPGYGPFDMENGIAPAECRCTMTSPPVGWEGYNGPEPAQWEQADDCPVHPLTADFPPAP